MATLEKVLNSNLTEEEKTKASEAHQKLRKNLVVFSGCWTVMYILLIIPSVILLVQGKDLGIILLLIDTFGGAIILIVHLLTRAKKTKYANWFEASYKVDMRFDGLDNMAIEYLKPNRSEQLLIKKCKKRYRKCVLNYIMLFVLDFIILATIYMPKYNTIFVIFNIILFLVCMFKADHWQVQIHRIATGYYKRNLGYICQNCKGVVNIMFQDIGNYEYLPRNEKNIRVMPCENCGNPVSLYNFDYERDDYNKYLEEIRKIEQ